MSTDPEQLLPETGSPIEPEQEMNQSLAKALSSAQEEITELKDKRREERLAWIVTLVIVIDCFVLLDADSWGGPLIIGLIQIAALSVLATRLGVEEFARLFGSMVDRVAGKAFGGD